VDFQICLSNAETEATTWSNTEIDHVMSQQQRVIYDIILNEQMQRKKNLPIWLVKLQAWWQAIGSQELRKPIIPSVIHFGYSMFHLASHVSHFIWRIGSGEIFTLDVSDLLHISDVKQRY
jgi:hypothetical protein